MAFGLVLWLSLAGITGAATQSTVPQQLIKDALPYAQLSDQAYRAGTQWQQILRADLIRRGYNPIVASIIVSSLASATGFGASITPLNGNIVIAFAGTEILDGRDRQTDLIAALGFVPTQYQIGMMLRTAVAVAYPGRTIELTGHSLGGGIAQYVASRTGDKAIVFNALGSPERGPYSNVVHIRSVDPESGRGDFAGRYGGYMIGQQYYLPVGSHLTDNMIPYMQTLAGTTFGRSVRWANVDMSQSRATAIVSGGISSIGSSAGRGGGKYTGVQLVLATGNVTFAESEWELLLGSAANLGVHSSYGSISPPSGESVIYSINNAGLVEAAIRKQFIMPASSTLGGLTTLGSNFTFEALANFVTTEFPIFVGTQFNDTAVIIIRSQSGQSLAIDARTLFAESVNASSFQPVGVLPAPLAGWNVPPVAGGHTRFKRIVQKLRLAPGSRVTIEVRTRNVGDTLYPSAVLVSGAKAH
jgi:hypothetical protein